MNELDELDYAGLGMHRCPAAGCKVGLPADILACRKHWRKVTPKTRRRVMDLWRAGASQDYLLAREAAIEEMNR